VKLKAIKYCEADQKASDQHQQHDPQHHDVIITFIFLAAIFPALYTHQIA